MFIYYLRNRYMRRDAAVMREVKVSSGTYMVDESKPEHSYKVFKEKIFDGSSGLYISRRILDENEELQNTTYYQLITTKKTNTFLNPNKLKEIINVIRRFTKEKNDPVVFIDGIEYLILMNNYSKVFKFLQKVREITEDRGATCIIPIDSYTLKSSELENIEKEFEFIDLIKK